MTRATRSTRTTRTRTRNVGVVTPAKAVSTIKASAQRAFEAGSQAAAGMRQSAVGAFDALVKQGAALEARSRHAALAKAEKARDVACARAARRSIGGALRQFPRAGLYRFHLAENDEFDISYLRIATALW